MFDLCVVRDVIPAAAVHRTMDMPADVLQQAVHAVTVVHPVVPAVIVHQLFASAAIVPSAAARADLHQIAPPADV